MAVTEITETRSLDTSGYGLVYKHIDTDAISSHSKVMRLQANDPATAYFHFTGSASKYRDSDTFVFDVVAGQEYRLHISPSDSSVVVGFLSCPYAPEFFGGDPLAKTGPDYFSSVYSATSSGEFFVAIRALTTSRSAPEPSAYTIELVAMGVSDPPLPDGDDDVTVDPVNEAPVLQEVGPFAVVENTTDVGTISATDVDSAKLYYAIIGGADAGLFDIDATSGALSFKSAPDFEAPRDDDGDNTYEVQVQVSDGDLTDAEFVFVSVSDEDEGGGRNEVFGSDATERVVGTVGDDIINSLGGPYDVLTGLNGADIFDFSTSSANGLREVRRITDFSEEDFILLAEGVGVAAGREVRDSTYLYLNGDRDVLILEGVSDFDTESLL